MDDAGKRKYYEKLTESELLKHKETMGPGSSDGQIITQILAERRELPQKQLPRSACSSSIRSSELPPSQFFWQTFRMVPSSTGGSFSRKRIQRNYSVIKRGKLPPNTH